MKTLAIAAVLFIFVGVGEILGIVKLIHCDFQAPYKAEILYGVGIPTGLNAVFGWMDFGR